MASSEFESAVEIKVLSNKSTQYSLQTSAHRSLPMPKSLDLHNIASWEDDDIQEASEDEPAMMQAKLNERVKCKAARKAAKAARRVAEEEKKREEEEAREREAEAKRQQARAAGSSKSKVSSQQPTTLLRQGS